MLRLWDDSVVNKESGMFAGSSRIRLFFPAAEILEVSDHCGNMRYKAGRDFMHTPGCAEIIRTQNSRIPHFSFEELFPEKNVRLYPHPDANAIGKNLNGGNLLFSSKNMFALNQIDITYRKYGGKFNANIDRQLQRLPRFRQKLAAGEKLRITLLGDSISAGCYATGFAGIAPFAPPYIDQVCSELTAIYGSEIELFNRASAGVGIKHEENIREDYCNDRADLLLVAYGMSDLPKMKPPEFIRRIKNLISYCRSNCPDTEIMLVSFLPGHRFWTPTVPGNESAYNREMLSLVLHDESVAMADVQTIWRQIADQKNFYDLTGNGVNHPNDYGHRIYASVLLEMLTGQSYF